ncbi:hypothetical protein R3P38DRAFT_3601672 [Favolaschia claudopus]|uniref:Uncharacterized protein n=1 Tax=Favolaschia claudopus TaxID=2862362 RepID=A0AAW0AB32_9AGAR
MLGLLPEYAEVVGAAQRKTNMKVGSKSFQRDLVRAHTTKARCLQDSIDCLEGSAGFSRLLSNLYPTSRLAALNFPAPHYSGWLESTFDWCCVPEPEFKLSRFLASRNFGCTGVRTAVGFALSNATRGHVSGLLSLLQREFGRRQANSALQLISQRQHQHPASLVTATFSPRILPPAGKNRPPEFKQRLSPFPHELFSSSRTRRAAALYRVDYTEMFPASSTASPFAPGILPPAGKSLSYKSNQRSFKESRKLFASLTTRRAAAQLFPASGVSGKSRSSELKAPSSRAMLLVEAPRSGGNARVCLGLEISPSRIPDFFGNLIFRRPANEVRDAANPRFEFQLPDNIQRFLNRQGSLFQSYRKSSPSSKSQNSLKTGDLVDFGVTKR